MIQSITSILILLCSFALALSPKGKVLSVEDFQAAEIFNYVSVDKAELVFSDELAQEDVYKVTYLVEGDCAASGNGDACELVPFCEYVLVDTTGVDKSSYQITGTEVACTNDIEDVIGDSSIDEL